MEMRLAWGGEKEREGEKKAQKVQMQSRIRSAALIKSCCLGSRCSSTHPALAILIVSSDVEQLWTRQSSSGELLVVLPSITSSTPRSPKEPFFRAVNTRPELIPSNGRF